MLGHRFGTVGNGLTMKGKNMKNRILKYLSFKEKESYTQLDQLFDMYLNGMMEQELTSLKYSDIEIAPYSKSGKDNGIQVNYRYYNLVCTIDFSNKRYEYVMYAIGAPIDQIKDSFVEFEYDKEFSIKSLINTIHLQLEVHPNLQTDTRFLNKRKKYKTIANVCLAVPCFITSVLAIYVLITKGSITLHPLFILIFFISITLWVVFDAKSAKAR